MDELVFPALCSRDLSEDFGELGDTVQVRKPSRLEAREFDAVNGVDYQDIKEESVDVNLSTLATVDVAAGAVETAVSLNSEEALERDFILPAARALAAKINSDGLKLYKDVYACAGTAGTPISTLNDLSDVRKALNLARVPEFGRKLIVDPEADAKLITVEQLASAAHSGDTEALRNGSLGRIFGMDVYTTQAVEKHVSGVSGSGVKLESASVEGDLLAHLAGTSLTGSFVKGDLIKIGSDSYTVTEGATAASNKATVKLSPALKAVQREHARHACWQPHRLPRLRPSRVRVRVQSAHQSRRAGRGKLRHDLQRALPARHQGLRPEIQKEHLLHGRALRI